MIIYVSILSQGHNFLSSNGHRLYRTSLTILPVREINIKECTPLILKDIIWLKVHGTHSSKGRLWTVSCLYHSWISKFMN